MTEVSPKNSQKSSKSESDQEEPFSASLSAWSSPAKLISSFDQKHKVTQKLSFKIPPPNPLLPKLGREVKIPNIAMSVF